MIKGLRQSLVLAVINLSRSETSYLTHALNQERLKSNVTVH